MPTILTLVSIHDFSKQVVLALIVGLGYNFLVLLILTYFYIFNNV